MSEGGAVAEEKERENATVSAANELSKLQSRPRVKEKVYEKKKPKRLPKYFISQRHIS